MKCSKCGGKEFVWNGHKFRGGRYVHEARCKKCRHYEYEEAKEKNEGAGGKFNILLLDIETMPIMLYSWGLWNQTHGINQIIHPWFMVSWSAKWLFEDEVYSDVLTPGEVIAKDDSRICKGLWKFLDHCDIVIGHNAKKFDIPKANWRFLKNGLNPPSPYQIIDTKKAFDKSGLLAPDSAKLDFVCRALGMEGKIDTGGFELWEACYRGDQDALKEMETYNRQDTVILESLYLKIRPWIKSHPNIGLLIEDSVECCGVCGSEKINWLDDHPYRTMVGSYSAFRCDDCGAVGRSRTTELALKKRKSLLTNAAR